MKTTNNAYRGIGFCDLLLIAFIALKLAGKINWSWIWVLCPFWGQFVILGIGFIILWVVNK